MNSTHLKLAIAALRMIALGLGILILLVAVGIIKLSMVTVKAIALGIKALNKWCDAQSGLLLVDTPQAVSISGSNVVALLSVGNPKPLITPPILPTSGNIIAIAPRKPAPKKRGRPSKNLSLGFA